MVTPLWFKMHCVENGFTGVGRKNCQVVGADHNLKHDPSGVFKVATLVWIFRDLWTEVNCEQRQHRQHKCINRGFAEHLQGHWWSNRCQNAISGNIISHFQQFRPTGVAPNYVALGSSPDGGPQEVRHLPRRFSPCGRVIILIYLLPVLQLLCNAVSDHLCGFIISAGAR